MNQEIIDAVNNDLEELKKKEDALEFEANKNALMSAASSANEKYQSALQIAYKDPSKLNDAYAKKSALLEAMKAYSDFVASNA